MSYGCYDRAPFRPDFKAADTVTFQNGIVAPTVVTVPFRMAPDCQYTHTELGRSDPRCQGCKWRSD